jgi:hypothetical protein
MLNLPRRDALTRVNIARCEVDAGSTVVGAQAPRLGIRSAGA